MNYSTISLCVFFSGTAHATTTEDAIAQLRSRRLMSRMEVGVQLVDTLNDFLNEHYASEHYRLYCSIHFQIL